MIANKVYKLKQDVEVGPNMPLKQGQEIEIVQDVVYINGHMVPPNMQQLFYNFVINNPNKFLDVTKNW